MDGISNAYAAALFSLSAETGSEKETLDALLFLKQVIRECPEYPELLSSPDIPMQERLKLMDDAFKNEMPENVMGFLKTLCERKHMLSLNDCISSYEKMYQAIHKISTARVTSAVPMTEEEKQKLIEKLQKKTGCQIRLECRCDPALLGGLIVQVEDQVLDGSLRSRLQEIKEVMKQ